MIIDTSALPTHIALVASRLNVTGPDSSGDTFLMASYLAEAAIKTIAVALHAGLHERSTEQAYRFGYSLVRADGLGTWERAIYECSTQPLASTLPPEFQPFIAWLTKKRSSEDEWLQTARIQANAVLQRLGVDPESEARQNSVRALINALVQIRNKTKAHGAVGEDFFQDANRYYLSAVTALVKHCPMFAWRWMHLSVRQKGNIRGILLKGTGPQYMRDAEASVHTPTEVGIYFVPEQSPRAYTCANLLQANRECTEFYWPNGSYNGQGRADFLNYASGEVRRKEDVSHYLHPPVPLPKSETHGMDALDVQANTFGNLPNLPLGYIRRPSLERELTDRLLDRNHAVVVLHGPGGIGKTYLALYVAHKISSEYSNHFEFIVWFSARDIDLRPAGPVSVRPAVADLEAVSRGFGKMFGSGQDIGTFAMVLESPSGQTKAGILFIFDNFETMSSLTELHKFLDTHTHLPNKVLITSRERAFKGDYPIEVRGMDFVEADQMMRSVARELSIEAIITDDVIAGIFQYTQGHAYVMRVILGEIAKAKCYVPPSRLMSGRSDIVNAVFERSFNKLSDCGKWVFLTVANWKSLISELALVITLGQRGLDAQDGIEECLRLSLITLHEMADGNRCYSSPQLARIFAAKKLEGDADRLLLLEDLEILRKFGVMAVQDPNRQTEVSLVRRFVGSCLADARNADKVTLRRLDSLLESVANLWPEGWIHLASFRQQYIHERKLIEYALRRGVEEMPFSKEAWLSRARYAESVNDDATVITSFVSAGDADPSDLKLLQEAAGHLIRYVKEHAIPPARRGIYLASVRSHMEHVADKLDATGLSELAWLFLLEGDADSALRYARLGAAKDPHNEHCLKILEKDEVPKWAYKKVAKRTR